ncbi:hypothetical protein HK405_004153, partial [Cladochytrium tenue]
PSEPGRPIPYLDEVALTFPDLVIIAGHIGVPWTDEMIGLCLKHENVYIDTSARRKKVLMGTNFPQVMFGFWDHRSTFLIPLTQLSWAVVMKQCKEIGIREECMEDFLGGNAARIFDEAGTAPAIRQKL